MDRFRYLPGVSTLKLNADACNGCGMCTMVCPHGVFRMENNKSAIQDLDGCMECGACAQNCQSGAIMVSPGVGCAAYIIQTWLKGTKLGSCASGSCC